MTSTQSTETLKITTPSDREVVLTRRFAAPRSLVFEAWTRPELLKRWFGRKGWTLPVCEVDLRVGGAWRYVMRGPDGREMGMRGVYREIAAPERLVYTEAFDDYPGESVVTGVFEESDGWTLMTHTVLCESQQIRDAILATGMEKGAGETYDRLEELLATLVAPR
jgi:uncharacterized protein YndB with AHSA1/START domain